jgi:hypothetical protein
MLLAASWYKRIVLDKIGGFLTGRVFLEIADPWWRAAADIGVLLFGVICFLVLIRISPARRKLMIVAVTFLAGLYWSVEFFIPKENFLSPSIPSFQNFMRVMGAWTAGLGLINIIMIHGANVRKQKKGYYNSVALFVALVAMLIVTIWKEDAGAPVAVTDTFNVLFFGFFAALKSAMWALLAFYIASAAYRAFRLKSSEAGLMMFAALLVMLGQVPVGIAITKSIPMDSWWAWARIENINTWLQLSPGMAARRAILLGASVGALAISLRIWLSLERGAYFDQEL